MWNNWFEAISQDLTEEDGVIITLFGSFTEKIFKLLIMSGVPFLLYVIIQFFRIS